MLEFRTVKFQTALFTPDLTITNSLKIANTVGNILGNFFDGEPSLLPIPQGAPADIPRIMLSSADGRWKLNISLLRTDLFFHNPFESDGKVVSIKKYAGISSKFFSMYQKKLNLRAQRLAFVTDRVVIKDDALDYVLEKFCNKDQIKKGRPFYNAKRFEIHSLKKYNWEQFHINSWVKIKFLSIKTLGNDTAPALLVSNDLNTLSFDEDPGASFVVSDIKQFFTKAPGHLDEILELYFS